MLNSDVTVLTVMAEDSIFKGGDIAQERLLNGVNVAETKEDKNAD